VIGGALEYFGIFVLGYFAVLNALYLVFTGVAWRSITEHLRERASTSFDELFASPLTPGVTIVLPAYNEQAGIVQSVRSLLRLRYPQVEVIVVNDGSTDGTLERLVEAFDLVPASRALRDTLATAPVRGSYASRSHPDLWVIDKVNGGKADALNTGVRAAGHPLLLCIDADAMVEEEALLRVAKPMVDDPQLVAATGGIVRIANGCRIVDGAVTEVRLPRGRLAAVQVVEYFRAFLVGRVGWSRFGSLLIISGAFGLFRRSLVEEVGGYATDTVGEDMELVVRLHRRLRAKGRRYKVAFVPDPVCWTEAPEDLKTLSRQRRRWQRGLTETLWRQRSLLLNPRYGVLGLVAMPYFVLFELLGPLVELAGYAVLPVAVAAGRLSLSYLFAFFVLAILLGALLSVSALALEEFSFRRHGRNRDVARLLVLALVESFGYRQLVGVWRVLGLIDVVRRRKGWGEMRRVGLGRQASGSAAS
jgi:cellulose synthase/poly-beta-1,6-N-acetylglucosamine synthase-like glycosyltransferase